MASFNYSAGSYPAYETFASPASETFKKNREDWTEVIKQFEEKLEWAMSEGDEFYVNRHRARGMLSARDRISLILDEGSPFLEIQPLAGYGIDSASPCGSVVCGIGSVHGVAVMFQASIPTIAGGALNEITVKKHLRANAIAIENGLPTITLTQGAGANLLHQFRVFHDTGGIFRDLAQRSEAGSPTCTVMFGANTGGSTYMSGMSDFNIFIDKTTQIFIGGPALVKAATGEVATNEELGGAEMHTTVSGVGDTRAADEFQACRMARSWVLSLNRNVKDLSDKQHRLSLVKEPRYDADSLLGIIPVNVRLPLNMADVIARIVDDSRFESFKPAYGPGMLCCWAHIHGHSVAIIGNQSPVIFASEANKAAHFIRLNNASDTPIVFLHNVTGFMVGKKSEQEGIIKAGSMMVDAVSRSKVPHISIICASSYGAANFAMCSRAYNPRFLFSWPHSRCSVMGPEQLVGVMGTIGRSSKRGAGKNNDLFAQIEAESQSHYTSGWGLDDGIIDPRDTRTVLAMCLEIITAHGVKGNVGFRGVSRL